jgi:wobble nucleotide-excising tRNase
MAIKITMNGVASYENEAIFETDKKVTLVYGLNGVGKSTLSSYLYNPEASRFKKCRREGLENIRVHVYNSNFIRDNFYEIDKLNGIFTLSKQNREVEISIEGKSRAISALTEQRHRLNEFICMGEKIFATKRNATEDETWKIKTAYSGGDRVLEYCLRGLMQAKGRLFEHLLSVPCPTTAPEKSIAQIRNEVELIQSNDAKTYDLIPKLNDSGTAIERDPIFEQSIIGNEHSSVANLIKRINNADWIRTGINYVSTLQATGDESCPFCQAKTLTKKVVSEIKGYFDETFEKSISSLTQLNSAYVSQKNSQPDLNTYSDVPFFKESQHEIDAIYVQLQSVWTANTNAITQKISAPSSTVKLTNSSSLVEKLNAVIDRVNLAISDHNKKIKNKESTLSSLKSEFWGICRYNHALLIATYQKDLAEHTQKTAQSKKQLENFDRDIAKQNSELTELQKRTVNIDDAINTINVRLASLGIDSFKITKSTESRYRISRNSTENEDFMSLSEGEKTVISFLYFVELCKGKSSPTEIENSKIVVIDDPISSLSHIYVFNIGQLIKDEFSNSPKFTQLIVLTHSLYFFYELADMKKERRDETQKLLRIIKNSNGSQILPMKYEEIQNDYQAYWNVVKDDQHHPALVANCMRNIIEYFFNFVKKMSLSTVFQQKSLQDAKHAAFCRYMNRESHSLGQNIYDLKEFDYQRFKDAFKLVFDEAGFPEHYAAMTK